MKKIPHLLSGLLVALVASSAIADATLLNTSYVLSAA
jgi:hypothetical protein